MVFTNNRAGALLKCIPLGALSSNKSGVETLVSLNNNKTSGAETLVSLSNMLKDGTKVPAPKKNCNETKVSTPKKNYNGTKVPTPIGRFA